MKKEEDVTEDAYSEHLLHATRNGCQWVRLLPRPCFLHVPGHQITLGHLSALTAVAGLSPGEDLVSFGEEF